VFGSCTSANNTKEKSDSKSSDSVVVEKENIPVEITNSDSLEFANLPLQWEMITHQNDEFVLYHPCDAANPSITIDKEKMTIDVVYGQDGNSFTIKSWKYEERPYKDEFEYIYTFETVDYYKSEKTLKLNYDKGDGVSGWSGVFDTDGPVLFIPERLFEKYPKIKQPCRECFSEEDCPD
jgi:hypothetical protein